MFAVNPDHILQTLFVANQAPTAQTNIYMPYVCAMGPVCMVSAPIGQALVSDFETGAQEWKVRQV